MAMEYIIWLVFAVLIVAAIILIAGKKGTSKEYDERQRLLRGQAYQHAFLTLLVYCVLYGTLSFVTERHFMEDGAAVFIGAFLGLAVFAVECVWRDAFFAISRTPRSYLILYAVVTAVELINTVIRIRNGSLIRDGLLTVDCVYPAMGLTFLSILVAVVLRRLTGKEAED